MLELNDKIITIGVDEVGRGCLMGPVTTVATLTIPTTINNIIKSKEYKKVKDSKKLSETKREDLYKWLTNNKNICYGIGESNVDEIEELNIRNATFLAMNRAIKNMLDQSQQQILQYYKTNKISKENQKIKCLIDGNCFKVYDEFKPVFEKYNLQFDTIIKGDDTIFNIAASSIIAKVTRDTYIDTLHQQNDNLAFYQWNKNKGYGTKDHIETIFKNGISIHHRISFLEKIFNNRNNNS